MNITKDQAVSLLNQEANKIRKQIGSQRNHLCIAQCKAFEEVVDTQMYGFSRQVDYAVALGILSSSEGHQLLATLEKELNVVYEEVYQEQKENH